MTTTAKHFCSLRNFMPLDICVVCLCVDFRLTFCIVVGRWWNECLVHRNKNVMRMGQSKWECQVTQQNYAHFNWTTRFDEEISTEQIPHCTSDTLATNLRLRLFLFVGKCRAWKVSPCRRSMYYPAYFERVCHFQSCLLQANSLLPILSPCDFVRSRSTCVCRFHFVWNFHSKWKDWIRRTHTCIPTVFWLPVNHFALPIFER